MGITAQKDIIGNTQSFNKIQILIHGADPGLYGLLRIFETDMPILKNNPPRVHGINTGQYLHQRRFPCSVLTDKPQNLSLIQKKVNTVQGFNTGKIFGYALKG